MMRTVRHHYLRRGRTTTRFHSTRHRALHCPSSLGAGFTLIELLVVIAILSLLVSILLPSLKSAKELAVAVMCQTNIRGTLTSMNMYTSDNRDTFPPCYLHDSTESDPYETATWQQKLLPYTGNNHRLMLCPANTFERWDRNGYYMFYASHPGNDIKIGYNHRFLSCGSFNTNLGCLGKRVWRTTANIQRPSDMVVLMDSEYWCGTYSTTNPEFFLAKYSRFPHNDTANFGFLDGHTERVDPESPICVEEHYWTGN